jgi:hypothetical protein
MRPKKNAKHMSLDTVFNPQLGKTTYDNCDKPKEDHENASITKHIE